MKASRYPVAFAVMAAMLYAIGAPFSKLLLDYISPMMLAALLYLGAGIGMGAVGIIHGGKEYFCKELRFSRQEVPFVLGMIGLDILAPILLMLGLKSTLASTASLLNNFEIVTTSLIALWVFHEPIGKKLWIAICLIVLASMMLSLHDIGSLTFSLGSLLVLLACVCWGFENNCTRKLSERKPSLIVTVKGFGAGLGAMLVACIAGERINAPGYIPAAMALGFVSYGLSIYCYVYAQRFLGAARTSAYYAITPFLGVLFSWLFLRETPNTLFGLALCVMLAGAIFATLDQRESILSDNVNI